MRARSFSLRPNISNLETIHPPESFRKHFSIASSGMQPSVGNLLIRILMSSFGGILS